MRTRYLLSLTFLFILACGEEPPPESGAVEDPPSEATTDEAPPDETPADVPDEPATDPDVTPETPEDPVDPPEDPVTPLHPGTIAGCQADGADAWTVADRSEPGPFGVGQITLTLTDPDRPTAAHGLLPELPGRTLVTNVWFPADAGWLGDLTPADQLPLAKADGPFPLIIHSHGFMSERNELKYAAQHLASHGFVVAAADYPLTNLGTAGGAQLPDVVNQPEDVSFIITSLLGQSMTATSPLYEGIDAERIGAMGTSLGGMTTSLVTYHSQLRDQRIKAAVTFAGPSGMFSEDFYADDTTPLMLVHGDIDAIVHYETNALVAMERAFPLAGLVTLVGGSHAGFSDAATLLATLSDNPDNVGCDAIAGNLPDNGDFLSGLGGESEGIIAPPADDVPCSEETLPPAMDVARQHMLTTLSTHAFFQLQFGDAATQQSACHFLQTVLPGDGDDVTTW